MKIDLLLHRGGATITSVVSDRIQPISSSSPPLLGSISRLLRYILSNVALLVDVTLPLIIAIAYQGAKSNKATATEVVKVKTYRLPAAAQL